MPVHDHDAVRPIRALLRGLETLEALNRRDGLTVSEVAQQTRLPRTTVYRMLETLAAAGFVVRDVEDERYRPGLRVRALADGFADEAWIREAARPEMEALCRRILWPLMLSTCTGGRLILRVVTDRLSPLALERYAPGTPLSITGSAGGIMQVALAAPEMRSALMQLAAESGASETEILGAKRAADEARVRGFALDLRSVNGEASVATPVRDGRGQVRAMLCMRFIRSALTPQRVIDEFVPELMALAGRVGVAIPLEAAPVDTTPARLHRDAEARA